MLRTFLLGPQWRGAPAGGSKMSCFGVEPRGALGSRGGVSHHSVKGSREWICDRKCSGYWNRRDPHGGRISGLLERLQA